jgi:hypothetical protein
MVESAQSVLSAVICHHKTWSFEDGEDVQIPTLPALVTRKISASTPLDVHVRIRNPSLDIELISAPR